jgi:hypothetical protein
VDDHPGDSSIHKSGESCAALIFNIEANTSSTSPTGFEYRIPSQIGHISDRKENRDHKHPENYSIRL